MKGFIELHHKDTELSFMININLIYYIDNNSYIKTFDDKFTCVKESYEEIINKIKQALEE